MCVTSAITMLMLKRRSNKEARATAAAAAATAGEVQEGEKRDKGGIITLGKLRNFRSLLLFWPLKTVNGLWRCCACDQSYE